MFMIAAKADQVCFLQPLVGNYNRKHDFIIYLSPRLGGGVGGPRGGEVFALRGRVVYVRGPSRERPARSFGPRRTSCAAGSWGSAGVRHSDLLSLGGGSGVFSGGSVSVAFLFIMEFFPFRRLFASCFPGCRGALSLVRGREGSCWPKRPKAPLLAPRHPPPPPVEPGRGVWAARFCFGDDLPTICC